MMPRDFFETSEAVWRGPCLVLMRAVLITFAQRERHSVQTEPNNCVQATPDCALLFILAQAGILSC